MTEKPRSITRATPLSMSNAVFFLDAHETHDQWTDADGVSAVCHVQVVAGSLKSHDFRCRSAGSVSFGDFFVHLELLGVGLGSLLRGEHQKRGRPRPVGAIEGATTCTVITEDSAGFSRFAGSGDSLEMLRGGGRAVGQYQNRCVVLSRIERVGGGPA